MRRVPLVLVVAAAAMSLPSTSSAMAAIAFGGGGPQVQFSLRGSNGYGIGVEASGRTVTLTASAGPMAATYGVPGRTSARGIEARIGSRGRIEVEFHASGSLTRKVPPHRCTGKPRVTRLGTFVGTIRFAGEHRYTKVDAGRARGSVRISPRWKCKPRHSRGGRTCKPGSEGPQESIVLDAADAHRRRAFGAFAERSPGEPGSTLFFASSTERRGRMRVSRFAFASGHERTFIYDVGLVSATVAPPPPFEGSATFQRNPDRSTSWKGSLRVSLPGAPHLALTRPAFDARLLRPALGGQGAICIGSGSRTKIR